MKTLLALALAVLVCTSAPAAAQSGQGPLPNTGSGITRDIGSIAIIEHDGSNYDKNLPGGGANYSSRVAVAKRFYQTHGDFYDFLVIFTNFEFNTGDATAFHSLVSNNVTGNGKPLSQGAQEFGSLGRLKGVVDMAALSRYQASDGGLSLEPGDPRFLATLNILGHELGHQWLVKAQYRDANGQISNDLLGRDGAHWSYLLDSDASTMYGSDWVQTSPGHFRADRVRSAYSSLDLYLMGLLGPDKVPPITLLRSPGVDVTRLPNEGDEIDATSETITIDQIVSALGTRLPDSQSSQKEFRVGFIFLTAPGTEPSIADLRGTETVRQFFASHFFGLTRGIGLVDVSLSEAPTGPIAAIPDLALAQSWLIGRQQPDGRFEDSATTTIRDTAAAAAALAPIPSQGSVLERAILWLNASAPENADFKARQVVALGPTASASRRTAFRDALLQYASEEGGFGLFPGLSADAIDTALVLQALRAAGAPASGRVDAAFRALTEARLPTGGWSASPHGQTSVAAIAEVLLAIGSWEELGRSVDLKADAIVALVALRNADGGFGENGTSTAYATAVALSALTAVAAPFDITQPAIAWLQSHQQTDGSWNGSVYETARVLSALRSGARPNLTLSADGVRSDSSQPEEGSTVRISARIRNVGRTTASPSHAAFYEGPPVAGATPLSIMNVPEIAAGGEAIVGFDYATFDKPGPHEIFAIADSADAIEEVREDDNAGSISFTVRGLLSDLEILPADLTISPEPLALGDEATIQIAVRNRGQRQAPTTNILVTLGDPKSGGLPITQAQVPSLAPGANTVLNIPWPVSGEAGVRDIYVTIDGIFQIPELDEKNNEASISFEVLPELSNLSDLALSGARFDPEVLQRVPSSVRFSVMVANRGRGAATSIVRLFNATSPSTPIAEQAVSLAGRARTLLSFDIQVATPGTRTIIARADPAGAVDEAREDNNESAASLTDSQGTVDLILAVASVAPTPSIVGREVVVSATLRNEGTASVTAVPVLLLDAAGHELARRIVSVAAAGSTLVSISWRPSAVGDPVSLTVRADPFNTLVELSETNNQALVDLVVTAAPETNLRVTTSGISFAPDPLIEGGSAVVSATIVNTSPVAANSVLVRFYLGIPATSGMVVGETTLNGVSPNSSAVAAITWPSVVLRGESGFFVVVDPANTIVEYDETDNSAFRPLAAIGYPDLVLSSGAVTLEPRFPRAGQTVRVRSTVRNTGGQPSIPSILTLKQGEGLAAVSLATVQVPMLVANEAQTFDLEWTPAATGDFLLTLAVDATAVVTESDEGNNLARLTVPVQDANLYLTEAYFSPDGDGARDTTTLAFRAGLAVQVEILDALGQHVRSFPGDASSEGIVVWDGRGDTGVVVQDGAYSFVLNQDGRPLGGRATAIVDTNREDLFGVLGTPMVGKTEFYCALPQGLFQPVWTAAEDALLFVKQPISSSGEPPAGLFRAGVDGSQDQLFTDPWYLGSAFHSEVSPDGREVALWGGFYGGVAPAIVDLITGERRTIQLNDFRSIRWSPDGRSLVNGRQVQTRLGDVLFDLPKPVMDYWDDSSWVWSPDGTFLADGNAVIKSDGTGYRELGAFNPGSEKTEIFNTVVRADGTIVATIGYNCEDGCERSSTYVIDSVTGAVNELPWLATSRGDQNDPPSPIRWSSHGKEVLYTWSPSNFVPRGTYIANEDGTNARPVLSSTLWYPSPRLTQAIQFEARAPGTCVSGAAGFALSSLANLTARLEVSRLPGNRGVALQATVSDRNLASYQLEYSLAVDPPVWQPIGPSDDVPVVDELLAVWVPPAPGTYGLRLVAEDRAGNVKTSTQIVSWDRTPVIANLVQSERLISPTGDGVRDAVSFTYLVLEPTVVEVRINGPKTDDGPGPLVRNLSLPYPSTGPASFVWDGRDGGGVVVGDGLYTVSLADLPFTVKVDSTPPEIAWFYGPLRYAEGDVRLQVGRHIVDPNLKTWTLGSASDRQIYVSQLSADGTPIFGPDGTARILIGADGRPANVTDVQAADLIHTRLGAVLTAVDRAGNTSSLPVPPVSRGLFLLSVCESDPNPNTGECGALRTYPNARGLAKLPVRTFFRLAETSGEENDVAPVQFEYRLRGTTLWQASSAPFQLLSRNVYPGTATQLGEGRRQDFWVVDFEVLGLALGTPYEGRFVRLGAQDELVSPVFEFSACNPYAELKVEEMHVPGVAPFLQLSLLGGINEPIESATLKVVTKDAEGKASMTTQPFDITSGLKMGDPRTCIVDFLLQLRGQSGRVYDSLAPCRKLSVRIVHDQACLGSSGDALFQSFGYCGANPNELQIPVFVGASTALEFEAGRPESVPVILEKTANPDLRLWNVADRSEGVELLKAGVRAEDTTLQVVKTLEVTIDKTPPTAYVLEPALDGDQVCPASDGNGGRGKTFRFVASDAGPKAEVCSAELRTLAGPGQGASRPIPLLCTAPSGLSVPCGQAGSPKFFRAATNVDIGIPVSLDDVGAGDYAVALTIADRAGNRTEVARRFSLDGTGIGIQSAEPRLFSPNGDGVLDSTTIRVGVARAATITASVEGVREILPPSLLASGQSLNILWDGRGPDGQTVPDGSYTVSVSATDACGTLSSKRVTVEVDNTPPAVLIVSPVDGSTASANVTVRGHADDLHFSTFQLLARPVLETTFSPVTAFVSRPVRIGTAGLLGNWSLPFTPGSYVLKLSASDSAGNRNETMVSVSVGATFGIQTLAVSPDLFSPNSDGRRETSTISYSLSASRRVRLEILSTAGVTVRTLLSGQDVAAGAFAMGWDGRNDSGSIVADGEYAIRLSATDLTGASSPEAAEVTVLIDATPPTINITVPFLGGVVSSESSVIGSVEDPLIKEFSISAFAVAGGSSSELVRGSTSRSLGDLSSLSRLLDGAYSLFTVAEDAAENRSINERNFIVDTTPPTALFSRPPPGAVLPIDTNPVSLVGTAADANLADFAVSYGRGSSPSYFTPLRTATTSVYDAELAPWSVRSLPDGQYLLRINATDKAGLHAEARRSVILDGTPPVALILSPASGSYANGQTSIAGTATDANLESWLLEVSPGAPTPSSQWTEVSQGTDAVEGGGLSEWAVRPTDGVHTFRLTVRDKAGHVSYALSTIELDTRPPRPPVPVRIDVGNKQALMADLRIIWLPSPDTDVSGYHVYRDDGELLTAEPVVGLLHVDAGRFEGTHRYLLAAVDRAGNESDRVAISTRLDLFAPTVLIASPAAGASVSGEVTIRGVAFSGSDFKEYRLFVEPLGDLSRRILVRRSTLEVSNGTLGIWTALGAGEYVFSLEGEDLSGNIARVSSSVVVDNVPPLGVTLVSLTPTPDQASLTASWSPSPSADVRGYLLYRNGRLANSDALVLGELRAFEIPEMTYASRDLPDGRHCFVVVARDHAGNRSAPSNELCADLDNRAPRAVVASPANGHAFDSPLLVGAVSADTDIASVSIEYRPAGTFSWFGIGAPDVAAPYQSTLDTVSLAEGLYNLRAVATDNGGRVDADPPFITVRFADITPPSAPVLEAHVDGDEVRLVWNAPPGAAGYRLYRDGELIAPSLGSALTYTDGSRPRGYQRYVVTAIDDHQNESPRSNEVVKVVYAPVLSSPSFPVVTEDTAAPSVAGVLLSGTLEIARNAETPVSVPSTEGEAVLAPLPLAAGPTIFRVRAIHPNGDRSLWSNESVFIRNEPPPPVVNVQATTIGDGATVQWSAVTDPELAGYDVARDDRSRSATELLTTASEVTGSPSTPWSYSPPAFAFDQQFSSAWVPSSDAVEPYLSVTLPQPAMLSRIALNFVTVSRDGTMSPGAPEDYRIDVRWEGRYLPIVTVRANTRLAIEHALPAPFLTDGIRVVLLGAHRSTATGIAEVGFEAVRYSDAAQTILDDPNLPAGYHRYSVRAVDRYGAFGAAGSTQVGVGDVQPPDAPLGLTAVLVGRDVRLNWSSTSPADTARFVVFRDGSEIAETPGAATTYLDVSPLNGVHEYRVFAVDAAWNRSAPSNTAFVTLAAPVLDPPVLSGSPGPLGESVLRWESSGALSYRLFRSLSEGGPYSILIELAPAEFRDFTVPTGATAWYVVRAVDAYGNASLNSNVVSVNPSRASPPEGPVILEPTDAANPIAIAESVTVVGGRAEPGALVRIYVDGRLAGLTPVEENFVPSGTVALPADATYVQVARNGKSALFVSGSFGPNLVYVWKDLTDGRTEVVPTGTYGGVETAVLSPSGEKVALTLRDATYQTDLWIFDTSTGALTPVEETQSLALTPAWSFDSTRLAFLLQSRFYPNVTTVEVFDLLHGDTRHVATEVPFDGITGGSLSFSPSGALLLYGVASRYQPLTLHVADLAARTNDTIGIGVDPSWNASGTEVFFTRAADQTADGVQVSVAYSVSAGIGRPLGPISAVKASVSGRWLAYLRDQQLMVEDTVSRRRHIVANGPPTSDRYSWLDDGGLVVGTDTSGVISYRAEDGHFRAESVGLQVGSNSISARATHVISGLESPDSLPISVTVQADNFPDLVVEPDAQTLYPLVPRVNQPSVASALIRNTGGASVENVAVSLQMTSPVGQAIVSQALVLPVLDSGASVRVALPFTPTVSGRHVFVAFVDRDNIVVERSEQNNFSAWPVDVVTEAAPLSLLVTVGRPEYPAQARALVAVTLTNGGSRVAGTLTTRVESAADGSTVKTLDVRQATLEAGGRVALSLTWDVGFSYAGAYRVRSTLTSSNGATIIQSIATVSVTRSVETQARLTADRYSVAVGGAINFAGIVRNLSSNAPLQGATARFSILNSSGAIVLQTDAPLPSMLPGGQAPRAFSFNPAAPVGSFTARLEVVKAIVLSSSETTIVVTPSNGALNGRLTLGSIAVLEQQAASAEAALTNRAAQARPGTAARVEVRRSSTMQIVESVPFNVDLPAAGSATHATALGGRVAGRYVVTLVDATSGMTLDRANLRVHAAIVPPSIHSPAHGSVVATPHPDLAVNNASISDGSTLTYEFQIFADPALTVALPGASGLSETDDHTAWHVPTRLTEDHTYYWRARASDGFSTSPWTNVASFKVDEINEPPFAPVPEQPEPGSRVVTREPSLTVRNAVDPEGDALTYEFRLASDAEAQPVIASVSGVPQAATFTSWIAPMTLTEDATYYWTARAFDGLNFSPWAQPVSFIVDSRNESPGATSPISPVGGASVQTLVPSLVAGLATDPENDSLVYRFEVDTLASFSSSARQASSDVAPSASSVSWTPPVPLTDNTSYFWRVAARDASSQGPWSQATFRVNLANDPPTAPVPLAPADGEIVTTNQPNLRVRNAFDPDGDALTYEFVVRDEAMNVVATVTGVEEGAIETAALTQVALAENGRFTWQARAHDQQTAGPWSASSMFRVNRVQDPPTAPVPFAPVGGVALDNRRPSLTWNNATSPEGLALTYLVELYRISGSTSTLVGSTSSLQEASPRTVWAVTTDLPNGSYSWRVRANDGALDGPWSQTALFSVLVDTPPVAPTGLVAAPGDGRITLTWNPSPESDVTGYRLYRSGTAGGPYSLIASLTTSSYLDQPRTNGVTQYYVVTAMDAHFESARSSEASATPQGTTVLAAQIAISPGVVAAKCLLTTTSSNGSGGSGGHNQQSSNQHTGGGGGHDDDDDDRNGHDCDCDDDRDHGGDHHQGDHDGHCDRSCPTWVLVRIELPSGYSASSISASSVRLAGSVAPDSSYSRIVDLDHDGRLERELRFRFTTLAPRLQVGTNTLSVSGTAAGRQFLGSVVMTVLPLDVEMKFTPTTLKKSNQGQVVQTQLDFAEGIEASEVSLSSIRLNGTVVAERVVSSHDEKITLKFNRAAVAQTLPTGSNVQVQVTGTIRGIPFTARDTIKVIQ